MSRIVSQFIRCLRHPLYTGCLLTRHIDPSSHQKSIVEGWRVIAQATLFTNCRNQSPTVSAAILDSSSPSTNTRLYHAGSTRKGVFTRLKEKMGFHGKMRYNAQQLRLSGLRMYLCCTELIDYDRFFQEFELQDTFTSWFRVIELHVWMCMVRLASEEREGQILRNNLLRNLWEDVEKRAKQLGHMAASGARKEGIYHLSEEFRASLFSYDEGILSDDRVLAGSIWRNFFQMKCENPQNLETLVQYVRKQVAHLDDHRSDVVLREGIITFLPLLGDQFNKDRTKSIINEIRSRT